MADFATFALTVGPAPGKTQQEVERRADNSGRWIATGERYKAWQGERLQNGDHPIVA